jgi:hypothetical protein
MEGAAREERKRRVGKREALRFDEEGKQSRDS